MVSTGCCFELTNSGTEADVEEGESCENVSRKYSQNYFHQDRKVYENERRQALLDYLEKFRCKPPRHLENRKFEKNPVSKLRHSTKVIRRSSALVKNPKTSVQNLCVCCPAKMNSMQDFRGLTLPCKSKTIETQTSRSQSRNSFHSFSRTTDSPSLRIGNRRKFPPVHRKMSNARCCEPLSTYRTQSSEKCSCFFYDDNPRTCNENFDQSRLNIHDFYPTSNEYVMTAVSTSEEDIIDYQVPIQRSTSSQRIYQTESESKTLVPTSSHITIRICSKNSSSSLHREKYDKEKDDRAHFSGSEDSSNYFEERVRNGLRAMCCCGPPDDDNFERKCENNADISLTECQISSDNFTPRTVKKSCYSKCTDAFRPLISFAESSDEGSFQKFKDALSETRRRKKLRKTSKFCAESKKGVPKSVGTVCRPKNKKIEVDRPRRTLRKRLSNQKINIVKKTGMNCDCLNDFKDSWPDAPIILSAQRYKEFRERCENIRKSIRNIMKNDSHGGGVEDISIWKGDNLDLRDLTPDLPPLDHWTKYEEGMKKVTDEYKTLKSCVNLIDAEVKKEKENPSCYCSTEKSVTRTYPSGTEFTFRVKRVPDKKPCHTFSKPQFPPGSKKSSSTTHRNENFRAPKGRTVCFEKSKRKKQICCDCPEVLSPKNNIPKTDDIANTEAMKTREADLLQTLETFCEKIQSMKSEFEKTSSTSYLKNSDHCRSCGRGWKTEGSNKIRAKKLLIFPPEGEDGPPLTLYKNSSSVNCRVKGDREIGFRYNVIYIQRFVSSTWYPEKESHRCCVDSG